jgi:YHS domain-containing protein
MLVSHGSQLAGRVGYLEQRPRRMTVAIVADPVCGLRIDTDEAVHTAEHEGTRYYFCSPVCRDAFVDDPGAFLE